MTLPIAVAVVVVVEHNDRFLMVEEERGGEAGAVWYFPAGALEAGETLGAAARREVLEESGYQVEPSGLIRVDHGVFGDPAGLMWWRFAIGARLATVERAGVDDGAILRAAWVGVDELAALNLRAADAAELCALVTSSAGLTLDRCRLSVDDALEGFFA